MTALSMVLLFFTAVLGVIRTVVALTLIEPSTGFYSSSSWLITAQNGLYMAGIVVLVIWALKGPHHQRARPFHRLLGVLLAAAGIVLGSSGVVMLCIDTVRYVKGHSEMGLLQLIAQALGIVAAAFMIVKGVLLFISGTNRGGMWFSALCALWMAAEVVARFMAYPTIASISDQTLEVVVLSMGAMFWLSHARMTSGGKLTALPRRAIMWSTLFALFSVTLCISQMISRLAVGGSVTLMSLPRQVAFLFLGVYAAVWGTRIQENQSKTE